MDAVDQARCVVVAVNDHDILVRIVFSELRSGTLGEGGLVIVITIDDCRDDEFQADADDGHSGTASEPCS